MTTDQFKVIQQVSDQSGQFRLKGLKPCQTLLCILFSMFDLINTLF